MRIDREVIAAGGRDECGRSVGLAAPFQMRSAEQALRLHIFENQKLNGETIRLHATSCTAPK